VSPWRFVTPELSSRYGPTQRCGRQPALCFQRASAVARRRNWRSSQTAPTGSNKRGFQTAAEGNRIPCAAFSAANLTRGRNKPRNLGAGNTRTANGLQSPNFQEKQPRRTNRLAHRAAGSLPSSCYISDREGAATTGEAPAKTRTRMHHASPTRTYRTNPFMPPIK